jgi:anti-anti-sigma factor
VSEPVETAQRAFKITSTGTHGERRLVLEGELDEAAAGELQAALEPLLEHPGGTRLILDLSGVTFLDSAGLRAVIELEQVFSARHDAQLSLLPPRSEVAELLRGAGLSERLTPGPGALGEEGEQFLERVELELAADGSAPARARAEVRAAAGESLDEEAMQIAVLLTSELVTNAVLHPGAGSPVGLCILVLPAAIRVEVSDHGDGFDPTRPPSRAPHEGGRGLLLVDHLAGRWGAGPRPSDNRFTVWFEVSSRSRLRPRC